MTNGNTFGAGACLAPADLQVDGQKVASGGWAAPHPSGTKDLLPDGNGTNVDGGNGTFQCYRAASK